MLENLFPNVPPWEQEQGKTRYRCIGVHNSHQDGTMYFLEVFFTKAVGDCQLFVGWAPEAPNTAPQQLTDETVPPTNVTFYPAGQDIMMPEQHLGPMQTKGLWFKLVIPPGARDQAYEYPMIRFKWGAVGA